MKKGFLAIALLAVTGCATFTTVRPAAVSRGFAPYAQLAVTTPPGDEVAWFYSLECSSSCNRSIGAIELGFDVGRRIGTGSPWSWGMGFNGSFPFLEAYFQRDTTRGHAFGVGGRLGFAMDGWAQHQVYLRFDRPLDGDRVLMIDPGLIYHQGHSPNGANTGSILGLVVGFGVERPGGFWVPTVSAGITHAGHTVAGTQYGPELRAFLAGGLLFRLNHMSLPRIPNPPRR